MFNSQMILCGCFLSVWTYGTTLIAFDTVVVRPAAWAGALDQWKAYRESQGHRVAEVDATADALTLRANIMKLAAQQAEPLRFVLLAGDVTSRSDTSVPTFYHKSTALSQFGGDAALASDNPYGDLDGDNSPELAVGRIPADSAQQLQAVLNRAIAWERARDFSPPRRDVHVIAGMGGFGAVADTVIEMTTRRFLADRIPGWVELSMTQASLKSHYCPDPWRFSEACIERMNQGGMFWVYIGHGHVQTLDSVRAGSEWLPILNSDHVAAVQTTDHPPIAVFLACYTGAFDALEDSLAEELVLSNNGPIAALAASRVSGPYGLAMLSDGLLSAYFEDRTQTLGEVVMSAKQRLLTVQEPAEAAPQTSQLKMIGAIASALSPEGYDLAAERREHVWEMNLLGDPLLRLSHPNTIELQVAERAAPGQTLTIAGTSCLDGQLTLELAYPREHVRRDLDALDVGLDNQAGKDAYQQRYQAANARVLVTETQPVIAGEEFVVPLVIPATLERGRYAVRAYLEGKDNWGAGYAEVVVRPEKP